MDVVIIPAYNEERHIAQVVAGALQHVSTVIVVDDGSRDSTSEKAEKSGAQVLRHRVNLGKGAALKTGCDYALQQGASRMVVIDADGQHDPQEIPRFLELLQQKDIIFARRKVSAAMPFVLKFGNRFISLAATALYGVRIHDTQCGYRAFTAPAYQKVRWTATDYFMETEMIINTGKHHLNYTEYPIETIYADRYKGTTVVDGMKIVLKLCGRRLIK